MEKGEFSLNADLRSLSTFILQSQDTKRNSQPPLGLRSYTIHKTAASESAFTEIITAAATNCIGQVTLLCPIIIRVIQELSSLLVFSFLASMKPLHLFSIE